MLSNQKLYPCKECGKEVKIRSKGLCPLCRSKQLPAKKQAAIPKYTAKTAAKNKETKSVRDLYFSYHSQHCRFSEESGVSIGEATRANVCHIFPKRIYESVQTNLDNYVYLTLDEHTRFDYLLDTLDFDKLKKEFPNVWKLLGVRYRKISKFITEYGKLKQKFEEYFVNPF